MDPQLVTIVVPFRGSLSRVEQTLERSWGNLAKPGIRKVLDDLGVVHFMGINALPAEPHGEHHLVLELTLDGSADYVLTLLARELESEIRDLLTHCEIEQPSDLTQFLTRHRCEIGVGLGDICGLAFAGTPGFTVRRIRGEAELAAWIADELARLPQHDSAQAKLKNIRERLWRDHHLKWAFEEEPVLADSGKTTQLQAALRSAWPLLRDLLWPVALPPALAFGIGLVGGPVLAAGSAALTSLAEVGAIADLYRRFRNAEKEDREETQLPERAALHACARFEDQSAQNHLIVLSQLKPGWLRKLSLRVALFSIRQAATLVFPPGKLSDISTIHFARWIVLPGTSQLLFLSNYGGSWDSYLEDFIIKAHMGLTGVWSNTVGFPRTSNLFFGGATNGTGFKAWARRQQRPTRFWYSAYPQLTTGHIRKHAAIRQGIAAPQHLDPQRAKLAADRWLALFGAPAPETSASVATEQVPALVFSGMPKLQHSQAWLMRFRDAPHAREWVASVADKVSYGDDPERTRAFALSFSASGLRKLGIDEQTLSSFPIAFQEDSHARAHKLGDTPADWRWGNDDAVDAIALLYASDSQGLQQLADEIVDQGCVTKIILHPRPKGEMREPFGFIDGISQPILRGIDKRGKRRDQLIAPGEIVLGYPDNSGFTPSTPALPAARDPEQHLPTCNTDPQQHDVGANGTFLVVRQLRQDVTAFRNYIEAAAQDPRVRAAAPNSVPSLKEWVAAKLMGRWPNGTSLVRYPNRPGPSAAPDNDFRFGLEDPDALACPLGAHIRRAHPRDSFDGSDASLQVANRHRILRVGRVYQEEGVAAGILFMCLAADIERQFEFIQQTWLNAPNFHGLNNEIDPVSTRAYNVASGQRMTIPTENGPVVLEGLREFVTVIGSGYFFMPGRACLKFLAAGAQASSRTQPAQAAE